MYQRGWAALRISAVFCMGAIMVPLKRLIAGLAVVSAAILVVLVGGHPVVATFALAASPMDGGSSGISISTACCASTGTSDGTSGGASGGTSTCADSCNGSSSTGPSLQLSKSQVAPGETITVTGNGYARCTEVDSQITSVQLLEDGTPLQSVTGRGGSFSAQVTVPQDISVGNHTVAAECDSSSVILASSDFTVTGPSSGGNSSPGQGGNSSPGQGGNSSPGQGANSSPGQGANSSPGQGGNSSPGGSSTGTGTPIALVSGTGGGLVLAVLFVVWAFTSHARKGRRNIRWVKEHLRAVVGSSPDLPSVEVHPRPGARSVSLGLEPHDDHLGNQRIEEVAR